MRWESTEIPNAAMGCYSKQTQAKKTTNGFSLNEIKSCNRKVNELDFVCAEDSNGCGIQQFFHKIHKVQWWIVM